VSFALDALPEIEALWEQYYGHIPKREFEQVMRTYTGKRDIDGVKRRLFLGMSLSSPVDLV
jgi:hypothetical protein